MDVAIRSSKEKRMIPSQSVKRKKSIEIISNTNWLYSASLHNSSVARKIQYADHSKNCMRRVGSMDSWALYDKMPHHKPTKKQLQSSSCLSYRNRCDERATVSIKNTRRFSSASEDKWPEQLQCLPVSNVYIIDTPTYPQHSRSQTTIGNYLRGIRKEEIDTARISTTSFHWLCFIRRLYREEYRKRKLTKLKLSTLVTHLSRLSYEDIKATLRSAEHLEYESQLTRAYLMELLTQYAMRQAKSVKTTKTEADFGNLKAIKKEEIKSESSKLCISDVTKALLQAGVDMVAQDKYSYIKYESIEEAYDVYTARFQEKLPEAESNKHKKEGKMVQRDPLMEMNYSLKNESIKSSAKNSKPKRRDINVNQHANLATALRSRQSLPPSLNPFSIFYGKCVNSSEMISIGNYEEYPKANQPQQVKPFHEYFNEVGLESSSYCRSPKQLMESAIFDCLPRMDSSQNNISFSLKNFEEELQISFEQSIQSLYDVLKRLKHVQINLQRSTDNSDQIYVDSCFSELNLFIQQLINYSLYRKKKQIKGKQASQAKEDEEEYFYTVKLENVNLTHSYTQHIFTKTLQSSPMREYFNAIYGLKIYNSPRLIHEIAPFLPSRIRILNVSDNNLSSLTFLNDSPATTNNIYFLNVSYNNLKNLSIVLQRLCSLRELHARRNYIDHISGYNSLNHLNLIDLAYNRIEKYYHLSSLRSIKSLSIINLLGNPILSQQQWKGFFERDHIYQNQELYVHSGLCRQCQNMFSTRIWHSPVAKDSWQKAEHSLGAVPAGISCRTVSAGILCMITSSLCSQAAHCYPRS